MDRAFDSLRRVFATKQETVTNGQQFWLKPGETVLVGSDPRPLPSDTQRKRLIKIPGVTPGQLSRTAVEISLDNKGRPHVISRTENNTVTVNYLNRDWEKYELAANSRVVPRIEVEFGETFIVDIETADGSLVRLNHAGSGGGANGSGLDEIGYRVDINPQERELNH